MKNLVLKLLEEQREGDWWDFKQEHHLNPVALLHDILCLSNVVHDGDRYLIYGVSDDYDVIGLEASTLRRTQADIISCLKTRSFAFHNVPEVELVLVNVFGKEIDVLVIKNRSSKPYFLTKDEVKNGVAVRSGTVYSRRADVNTPKNSCANPYEIEAMWRERFGLDKKASERFVDILLDTANWKYDGISSAFYDLDPDYTIEIVDGEEGEGKFWWERNLTEKPRRFYYHLRFKNVELHSALVISYFSEGLCIPCPEIEYITYPEKHDGLDVGFYCDFFYFIEGTIKHSLLVHIRTLEVSSEYPVPVTTPLKTQIKPPIIELPFAIFRTEAECEESLERIKESLPDFIESVNNRPLAGEGREVNGPIPKYDLEEGFGMWSFGIVSRRM